jgi:hypothetical protein
MSLVPQILNAAARQILIGLDLQPAYPAGTVMTCSRAAAAP